jgi:hypothetical protein
MASNTEVRLRLMLCTRLASVYQEVQIYHLVTGKFQALLDGFISLRGKYGNDLVEVLTNSLPHLYSRTLSFYPQVSMNCICDFF